MVSLIDLLQQKIEIFRLEQRYTKRRNRRSTFVSEAQYVDGEYIYSPTSSNYSAKCSAGSSDSEGDSRDENAGGKSKADAKGSRRLSKMAADWRRGRGREDKRQPRVSVREVKWDSDVRT